MCVYVYMSICAHMCMVVHVEVKISDPSELEHQVFAGSLTSWMNAGFSVQSLRLFGRA